jgi:UDP-N-acetylglucosamine--N-acetylmuramyl-(pentapeptide) pyrophosphoryl-undecaprenol N-acetylglucosamine transferase
MKVVITGGGTGGHIYPATAILEKIKKIEPSSEFLYIGTHNRMEKDLVPKMGIRYEAIKMTGISRKINLQNIRTFFYLFFGILKSRRILKKFNPDVVVGTGGYVTVPVIYAASKLKIPTFIHEQNATVGMANRFLSKYATKIGVSFEDTLKDFPKDKVFFSGNPRAEQVYHYQGSGKTAYGFSKDKKLVLVVSGSLGARVINESIYNNLEEISKKDYEMLFVTGNEFYEEIKNNLRKYDNIKVVPFIDLAQILKDVDLMVTRAGATTISEINAIGIASIMIPSPNVVDDHQVKNARNLEKHGAAVVILEDELTGEKLINEIDRIINNSDILQKMRENSFRLGVRDSALRIYEELKAISKKNVRKGEL